MSNRDLPMMPWYPDQFAASVNAAGMSWQEEYIYRRLLDAQWAAGNLQSSERVSLTNNEKNLSRICRMPLHVFRKFWPAVKDKFVEIEPGRIANERLEKHMLESMERKRKLTDAARLGGQASVARRLSHRLTGGQPSAVPSVNSLSPSPSEESKTLPYPPREAGRVGSPEGSPRENGTNPRALHTNPREQGTNPRALRDRSKQAWRASAPVVAAIRGTDRTWNYAREQLAADPAAIAAVSAVGEGDWDSGCRRIADRDRYTTAEVEATFREAYEQQLDPSDSPSSGPAVQA